MDMEQSPEVSENKKLHWSLHPWKLLGLALAALLVTYLVELAAPLASRSLASSWLGYIMVPIIPLLFASAFYFPVRAAQRKQGVNDKACWRPGVVFFVGLGLLLVYVWLIAKPTGQWFDVPTIAMQFLYAAANGLSMLLFYHLLFPSFGKRMGEFKTVWALGTGFALLAILERVCIIFISGIYNVIYKQMGLPAQNVPSILSVFFPGILLPLCVSAFALAALRTALYHRASKRMLGTWMLFSAIPLLLSYACSAITQALTKNRSIMNTMVGNTNSSTIISTVTSITFYLIIFAVCLGLMAAFRRWKTFGAFWADVKGLKQRTQEDVEE